MAFRVIQWATGGVGKAAIEGILDHPELELVGCWVHGADKDGRDVGEIVGRAPIGVRATRDVDALRFEAMNAAVGFVSEDLVEGFAAGREKRPARFEGK